MEPVEFNLDQELTVTIVPARGANGTFLFQLYAGGTGNSLRDLSHYWGLISFEPASQQFYYSPGNRATSSGEILQLIEHIKNDLLKLR